MDKKQRIKKSKYIEIYNLFYNKKYNQVIKSATKYLEEYGENQKIIYYRALSYAKLKEYDKTINDLKHNIDLIESSVDYYPAYKTYKELYFIYYKLNMYTQAYSLIDKIEKYKSNLTEREIKNFEISEIIIKYNLGIRQTLQERYKYLLKQLYNYNEEEVLNHIKKCHSGNMEFKTNFFDKINIDYLYNYLKENLNNYKNADINTGLDIYFFSIANIGIDYTLNSACNILTVAVIPGVNKIISMYPSNDSNDEIFLNPLLNIDYDRLFSKNKEKVKTKAMSQIDKFNKRYSR